MFQIKEIILTDYNVHWGVEKSICTQNNLSMQIKEVGLCITVWQNLAKRDFKTTSTSKRPDFST
jgi:hypothetical protein